MQNLNFFLMQYQEEIYILVFLNNYRKLTMELEPQSEITQNILMQKKLNLSMKEFEILNIIGNGSQGDVYEASSSVFQQKIAIKAIKMPKSHFRAEKFMKRVQSQIIINTQIEKPSSIFLKFFPRFYGYFIENETFHLIFQLCSRNAFQLFKNLKTYQQKYIFSMVFFHDVIKSLHLLENKKILHRDIKLENILFKENYFKLTDLGLAKDSFALKNLTIDVGNLFSKSPQIYEGKCDTKSDVWSLGITLYYLLENDLPFDEQTVKMMQGQKVESFFERMRNKQFSININQRHQFKQKDFHIIDLYEILSQMIVVNAQNRSLASEINSEYFSEISVDSIDYQEVFRNIIFSERPWDLLEIKQFLKYLLLKHLEHRSTELGMYFIIFFSYIKEILKINKKMSKIKKIMDNQDTLKNKKKLIELELLKNIKSSSFRLIQLLHKLIIQESSQKGVDVITSFGQIQLSIQKKEINIHPDQKKLQKTIQLLLQYYEQFKHQFEEKQNIFVQKQVEEQQTQKSVRFHNVLVCISQDNSQQQFKTMKLREKQCSKVKSKKKIQAMMNEVNQRLPKSMKYLNQNLENISIKQNEILSNFLKFYTKDKFNEKFLLLGQVTQLLKKLLDSTGNPSKRATLFAQDFKIWNLSLGIFNF